MEVKIVKKAAIVCAMVLMISIVPAFALNSTTNNSTGVQVQNQSGTCDQTQTHDQTQAQNHDQNQNCQNGNDGTNCNTCDGDQHKYQNGQKNAQTGTDNSEQQNKYQYGLKNSNTNKNCDEANCPKN
jgi:hypothetical protein